ncbi:MAG: deoxyhypusine synthase family protein [Planctomycetes bacterium]|nr:deoxyhypusine synthase family protein [Planctomycetota bacterium]
MPENPGERAPRTAKNLRDGWSDNLQPLEPFDVRKASSASAMLEQMARTSFGARSLGEAAEVLHEMVDDPKCLVVGTFSGAMTVAKMGLLIAEMIDQRMLDAVVSTGALLCHGLVEQTGGTHFRYDPSWDDTKLFEAGYDRIYDTLELEKNLYDAEQIFISTFKTMDPAQPFGSWELNRKLGGRLREADDRRGILQSAAARDIPIYIPAFTDSELGLDVFTHNFVAEKMGTHAPIQFDPMRDVRDYYERVDAAERIGIFTIGGGVPRNWAQQIGPLGEVLFQRTGGKFGRLIRIQYAVRICPEPTHWGGLSGCTYSEGVSWGKFVPKAEGGRFAEVYADATIAWPIVVRGVLERMGRV